LLALFVSGQSINVISIIGLIALLGVVANDAIVKVDAIRRLRVIDGLPGREAIMTASRLRFRPIVMNTLTAVFGMVPMAIGIGTGEQTQRPLAISIIGGLTFSTVLTLFMTPVIYELVHRRTDRDYETGRLPGGGRSSAAGRGCRPRGGGQVEGPAVSGGPRAGEAAHDQVLHRPSGGDLDAVRRLHPDRGLAASAALARSAGE